MRRANSKESLHMSDSFTQSSLLLASHDAFNNGCRFRLTRSMRHHAHFYSGPNKLAFNFIPPPLLHSSPLQVSRIRTKRRLSVEPVGGVCTDRKIGVVAMAAWTELFPSPGHAALYFMDLTLAVSGPVAAFQEVNGENAGYSKFASEGKKKKAMIASKTGMFLIYFPAAVLATVFLACRLEILPLAAFLESSSSLGASGAASFWENALVADADGHRLVLVAAALFVHFWKRVLEVLFVHNYSGSCCVDDIAHIASFYASQVCFLLYSQLLSAGSAAPFPNLKWPGVALFLIGVTGNAYHHRKLSQLRKDGNKKSKYVVPQGGLFGLLVCPHYVFEMIDFVGIALISQSLFSACTVWFVLWYLTGRTIATKKWYMKKVEGFPEERSVLIPGIF